jgi:hypothetical protein
MVEGLVANAGQDSSSERVVLEQLVDASKHLAQEVEAAWQVAPQGAAMFQGPVGAR